VERLSKWACGSAAPVFLIFVFGYVVIVCGQESVESVIVTIVAVVLPTAWSIVAMRVVLCLGTKGRSFARGKYQRFLFFVGWILSSMMTGRMLLEFPYIRGGAWLKNVNWANVIIVFPVGCVFVWQYWSDNRNKKG